MSFLDDIVLMNASGPHCTELDELLALAQAADAVVTKSATIEKRNGNEEPRWAALPLGGIQSMGLPNHGFEYYAEASNHLAGPVILSVSGLSQEDNLTMIKRFDATNCTAIELNISCPNLANKPQLGYDFDQTRDLLSAVARLCPQKPFGLKLPPYFDDCHYKLLTDLVNAHDFIQFVTCINSVGNCLVINPDTDMPVIHPKGGLGGLCGGYVKPVGLANVLQMRRYLREDIKIIGAGGIETGRDAFEYFLVGADAVQIGSQFQKEGVGVFARIESELRDIMKEKAIPNVKEIRLRFRELPSEQDENQVKT